MNNGTTGPCINCGEETGETVKTHHSELPGRVHQCPKCQRKAATNERFGRVKAGRGL